jgi:ABC-type polysaccharide/polyol phosphate export permease
MYFLRGILPWQNMKATTAKAKYSLIKNKKIITSLDIVCKGFPS